MGNRRADKIYTAQQPLAHQPLLRSVGYARRASQFMGLTVLFARPAAPLSPIVSPR